MNWQMLSMSSSDLLSQQPDCHSAENTKECRFEGKMKGKWSLNATFIDGRVENVYRMLCVGVKCD